MEENRIVWIDIAKGIAIILMVIGHSTIPSWLSSFIWTFHMPLFFIASGWTTKKGMYSNSEFLKRKVKNLFIPFIFYSLVVLMIEYFMGILDISTWVTIGWHGYALWFIPVLFVASMLAKIILDIGNQLLIILCGIVMALVGSFFCYEGISLPWTMSSVPLATFFIITGSYCRDINIFKPYLTILCLIITILISQKWRLDMASNHILPIVPIVFGSIAGTFMVFSISSFIVKYAKTMSKCLGAIGRETFMILAFSQIIIMALRHYTPLGGLLRYIILIVTLLCLKFLKDRANHLVSFKIFA